MSLNQKYALLFGVFGCLLVIAALYAPIWYDDAGHYIVIRELIGEGVACYPVELNRGECDPNSPFITMGPALNYPLGSWMRILGTSMLAGRSLMVLLSLQSLLAFLLLARRLVQPAKAFWAVALVIGNIQLVTYGAEILGEVPMLGWLFLGLAFQLRWWANRRTGALVLATLAYLLAILTKEYIAAPLALGMAGWITMAWLTRQRAQAFGLLAQGLAITLALLAYHWVQAGSWEALVAWFRDRGSYGAEFLRFDLLESFRFLLFKPLIALGTLALFTKVYFRRTSQDIVLACFHLSHLLFFLFSAGYDRFGFQLLFIPAIYLSEFIWLAWNRLGRHPQYPRLLRGAFGLFFLLLFTQRTLPTFAGMLTQHPPSNAAEHALVQLLQKHRVSRLFTYDQQVIPFLSDGYEFRLCRTVPSNAGQCQPLVLRSKEWLVAGPYARTEFGACWPQAELLPVDSTGTDDSRYVLYLDR